MKKQSKYARCLTVAVTGGIGSGKTEVMKCFERCGAQVLYADLLAKEMMNGNQRVKDKIRKAFGNDVYTIGGILDPKRLAKIVFQYDDAKETINSIVHPEVLTHIQRQITEIKSHPVVPVFVVEAALIYESHSDKMFDYVIVVDADTESRIDRVIRRDGLTRAEVLQRVKTQLSSDELNRRADFVIHNAGDVFKLEQNCKFLFQILSRIAQGTN